MKEHRIIIFDHPLKQKIKYRLKFVKDFQQDIIADIELITGVDMPKKLLVKILAKEIDRRRQNGSMDVSSSLKKIFYKRINRTLKYEYGLKKPLKILLSFKK